MATRDEMADTARTKVSPDDRGSFMTDIDFSPATVLDRKKELKAVGSDWGETRGMADTKAAGDD